MISIHIYIYIFIYLFIYKKERERGLSYYINCLIYIDWYINIYLSLFSAYVQFTTRYFTFNVHFSSSRSIIKQCRLLISAINDAMLTGRKFNFALVKPKLYRAVKNGCPFINFAGRTMRISLRVRRVRRLYACIIIIVPANLPTMRQSYALHLVIRRSFCIEVRSRALCRDRDKRMSESPKSLAGWHFRYINANISFEAVRCVCRFFFFDPI